MKLGFYEKVVVRKSVAFPEYEGRTGVVLGISEEADTIYGYSVFFPGESEGVRFPPGELQGTGEFVERGTLYDENDRLHIKVEDGEGSIIDDDSRE